MWVYRHRVPILAGFGGLLLAGVIALGYFTTRVVGRFDGRRWNLPSRIYSDLYALRPGDAASIPAMAAKLGRLFYQETDGPPERPGHFRREKDALEIFTRGFRYPGRTFPGARMRVVFASGRVKTLTDAAGDPVPALILEPELLGSVFDEELEDRTLVRLAEVAEVARGRDPRDRRIATSSGTAASRCAASSAPSSRTRHGAGCSRAARRSRSSSSRTCISRPSARSSARPSRRVMAVVLDARVFEGRDPRGVPERDLPRPPRRDLGDGRRRGVALLLRQGGFRPRPRRVRHARGHHPRRPDAYSPVPQSRAGAAAARPRPAHDARGRTRSTRRRSTAAIAEPLTPPQPRRSDARAPALRGLRPEPARRRRYGRTAGDRGPPDLHDARRGPAAGGRRRPSRRASRTSRRTTSGWPRRAKQAPLQGALIVLDPETGARARARRRPRLPAVAVQPRDAGAPPAGHRSSSPSSTSRRSRGAISIRPITPGDDPDGLADHARLGAGRATRSVDAAQLRRRIPRADVGAPGARAVDQHPDRARRRARRGPAARRSARRGRAGISSPLRGYPSLALGAFETSPMEIAAAYCAFAERRRPRDAERDPRRR